jgi:hypothetical protein
MNNKPDSIQKDERKKVFVFLPCCKSKKSNFTPNFPTTSMRNFLNPNQWQNLQNARGGVAIANIPGTNAPHGSSTVGLYLYHGNLWHHIMPIRQALDTQIQSDNLQIFILSGWYGVLHAHEEAQDYTGNLQGQVANYWRNNHLERIISDIIVTGQPDCVLGYFTGDKKWHNQDAMYRYFFTEGVKHARGNNHLNNPPYTGRAGCFYGYGLPALHELGVTFVAHYQHNNNGIDFDPL